MSSLANRFDSRMTIYLIVLMGTLVHIGFTGSRVAVSLYALNQGANQIEIGALVALYAVCPALLSIVIGKFSDRVATRVPMIIGAAGVGIALLLPVTSPGIAVLFAVSFLVGLFNQTFNIPMEAILGGIGGVDKRARNYALAGMGFSTASFFGPLLTGFAIDHIGYLHVFPILAAFTLAPILILWFMPTLLPKVTKHSGAEKRGSILDLWRIPALRSTFIAGGIIASAWDLFQFYLPIYGHSIGLSASAIGTIIGTVAIATFVVRGIVPLLVKRLTETQIMTYSIFISALAFVLLPFFVNPYALAGIGFLIGMGIGCAQPISMSLIYVLTPQGRVAEATGLRKTVNQSTHLVIPLIFGSVGAAFGFMTVFLSTAIILAAGGFLMQKTRVPTPDSAGK